MRDTDFGKTGGKERVLSLSKERKKGEKIVCLKNLLNVPPSATICYIK
jgi:hypothetical protein